MSAAPARRRSKASRSSMSAALRTAASRCSATMSFQGQQAVVGGAYAYHAPKNGVSTPTTATGTCVPAPAQSADLGAPPPARSISPACRSTRPMPGAAGLNELPTLQQRVGNRVVGQRQRRRRRADLPSAGPATAEGHLGPHRRRPSQDRARRRTTAARLRRRPAGSCRPASTGFCSTSGGRPADRWASPSTTERHRRTSPRSSAMARSTPRLRLRRHAHLVRQQRLLCRRPGAGDLVSTAT